MKKYSFALLLSFIIIAEYGIAGNFLVTARMKNGDVLSGKTSLNKLQLKTTYGDLMIPADHISNITLGVNTDRTKEAIVTTELKKLQMASNIEAATIYNKLLEMGAPILAIVKEYTENNSYQISDNLEHSVEQLLDALYKKADIEYGNSVNDIVEFNGTNIMEGNIILNDILLNSNYGNLTLSREAISSIELVPVSEDAKLGDNLFLLKANKHISGNDENKGWLNTAVKVKKGDKYLVNITGKIILQSLSGGVYGPNGYIGGKEDSAYDAEAEIPYGSVVYKLNESGDYFRVGNNEILTFEEDGTLYLSIYETVYNEDNTGSYTLKLLKK